MNTTKKFSKKKKVKNEADRRLKGTVASEKWILIMKAGVLVVLMGAVLFGGIRYLLVNYNITTIYVEGSIHYTNEEVIAMVMNGGYTNNSLLLSFRYRDKSISGVPFVEKMDVSVLDPHTVKIDVYEKALAGYVEYLDRYMYFDREGIIVESSDEKTPGIPQVTGLSYDHVVLHEPLPVDDPDIFRQILNITQLVNKYSLSADRIYFGSDGALTLYFENVKASLGTGINLEEKIMRLQYMIPELSGKKGTIRMENYTEETKSVTFEPE